MIAAAVVVAGALTLELPAVEREPLLAGVLSTASSSSLLLSIGCSSCLMLCRRLPFLPACAVCLLETALCTLRVFISTLSIGIDRGTTAHCSTTVRQSASPSLSLSLPPRSWPLASPSLIRCL